MPDVTPANPAAQALAMSSRWRFEKPRIVHSTPARVIDWVLRMRDSGLWFSPLGTWQDFENANGERAQICFMPMGEPLRNPERADQTPPPGGWDTETLVLRARIVTTTPGEGEVWQSPWDFAVYRAFSVSDGPPARCEVFLEIDARYDFVLAAMKQEGWRPLPGPNGVTDGAEENEAERRAAIMTASHAFYWEFYRALDRDFPEGKPEFRAYELMAKPAHASPAEPIPFDTPAAAPPAEPDSTIGAEGEGEDVPDRGPLQRTFTNVVFGGDGFRKRRTSTDIYRRWVREVQLRLLGLSYSEIAEALAMVGVDATDVKKDFDIMRKFGIWDGKSAPTE